MTRTADLDAARKARAEKQKKQKPPTALLGGKRFTLPPALPAAVIVALARARNGGMDALEGIADAAEALFGEQTAEVLRLGLELEDFGLIIEQAYGDDTGEAPASAT